MTRHDLPDLGMQPLTHLRASVIDGNRTIFVHVQQGTGLIQEARSERYTELDRRESDSFLERFDCAFFRSISFLRAR